MAAFIRKNVLVATAVFTAADGSNTQPSSATCIVRYKTAAGPAETSLDMTFNSGTNNWTANWDSSAALRGVVEWMIYGAGALQAAAQGQFQLDANAANTV